MNAHEWWHAYVNEHGITPGSMEAYNAGMERAVGIIKAERNDLASPSYNDALDVVDELIRKEIDNG